MQSIDVWAAIERKRIYQFVAAFKVGQQQHPEVYPTLLPEEEWAEHFRIFQE